MKSKVEAIVLGPAKAAVKNIFGKGVGTREYGTTRVDGREAIKDRPSKRVAGAKQTKQPPRGGSVGAFEMVKEVSEVDLSALV